VTTPAIQLDRLARAFRDKLVLREATLSVAEGECVVIAGPNGSGKTTLLEIVATLLAPSSGCASVQGRDVVREAARVRGLVGYCPSKIDSFYPRLSGRANLRFFAALYGVDGRKAGARIEMLLDVMGLRAAGGERVQTYSDGMKARLSIARAFLADPPVLLLDEPSKSLDAAGKLLLRGMLGRGGGRGPASQGTAGSSTASKTRLWVTHDAAEGEAVADRVLGLDGGWLRLPAEAGA
jgi:ABC-2 type transport system ATP-binding protein